jgi:hypothetical protein
MAEHRHCEHLAIKTHVPWAVPRCMDDLQGELANVDCLSIGKLQLRIRRLS